MKCLKCDRLRHSEKFCHKDMAAATEEAPVANENAGEVGTMTGTDGMF